MTISCDIFDTDPPQSCVNKKTSLSLSLKFDVSNEKNVPGFFKGEVHLYLTIIYWFPPIIFKLHIFKLHLPTTLRLLRGGKFMFMYI